MLKKWWFWTIIVLIVIIIILLYILISKTIISNKIDNSNLSSFELIQYLKEKGYTFGTDDYKYIYNTHYVFLRNNSEGILIQKISPEISSEIVSFHNDLINDAYADISSKSANTTKEEMQQYEAFLNWLSDFGISKMQLINALEYYDNMEK